MLKKIDNVQLECTWSDFHDVRIQYDDGEWFKKNDPKIQSFFRRKRKPINIAVKYVATVAVGSVADILHIEALKHEIIIPIKDSNLNIDEHITEQSYKIIGNFTESSQEEPLLIASNLHTYQDQYWLYQGNYYKDTDRLTAAEVKALIVSRTKMKRARINRAVTIANAPETPIDEQRRGYIAEDIRLLVWERDGGKCVKCGARHELQFDHIIPFSLGGGSTEHNLQILCGSCNRAKSNSVA